MFVVRKYPWSTWIGKLNHHCVSVVIMYFYGRLCVFCVKVNLYCFYENDLLHSCVSTPRDGQGATYHFGDKMRISQCCYFNDLNVISGLILLLSYWKKIYQVLYFVAVWNIHVV